MHTCLAPEAYRIQLQQFINSLFRNKSYFCACGPLLSTKRIAVTQPALEFMAQYQYMHTMPFDTPSQKYVHMFQLTLDVDCLVLSSFAWQQLFCLPSSPSQASQMASVSQHFQRIKGFQRHGPTGSQLNTCRRSLMLVRVTTSDTLVRSIMGNEFMVCRLRMLLTQVKLLLCRSSS